MIKAIDTRYKGYYFRSRLEARWAVFFDALGLEYQYEPEGFELDNGEWYLPDFFLPHFNSWVEIKPTEDKFDFALKNKMSSISSHFKQPFLGIAGNPGTDLSYNRGKTFSYDMFIICGNKLEIEWQPNKYIVPDNTFEQWYGFKTLLCTVWYNKDLLEHFSTFINKECEIEYVIQHIEMYAEGNCDIFYNEDDDWPLQEIKNAYLFFIDDFIKNCRYTQFEKYTYLLYRYQDAIFEYSTNDNICIFGLDSSPYYDGASNRIVDANNRAKSYRF